MRVYPVPFRRLEEAEQYHKFDWLEFDLVKARADPRPESWSPVDPKQMIGESGAACLCRPPTSTRGWMN